CRAAMAELEALKLLRALDEGVAAKTGTAFFEHLVGSLAKALDATCAFASEINAETYRAQVLAYWHNGELGEVFEYALSGTPCECVLDNQTVAFPRNIQQMFPQDREWFASRSEERRVGKEGGAGGMAEQERHGL